MNDDDNYSFEHLLATAEAREVDLSQLDQKLSEDFWESCEDRITYQTNFECLKRTADSLHPSTYRVDAVGMDCNMENDFVTLCNALEKAIYAEGVSTFEDSIFLTSLSIYRTGVKKMEAYQEGVREFLRLARIKYEGLWPEDSNGLSRYMFPFEKFLRNYSCMKVCYVANHGIIAKKLSSSSL